MKRHLGLDVLRGVAVLLVLGAHLPQGPPSVVVERLRFTGWIGVDLFFVLSGFLVSGLLFREHQRHGRIRVGRFLWRRGLKIYPAYYVFLGLTILWSLWLGREFTWLNVVFQAVYLQNYEFLAGSRMPFLWDHTWTLAVEEHFYLLLAGWFVWMCRRGGPNPFRSVPWICLGVSVVCLGLRCASMQWLEHSYATHYAPTHLRIDSLTTGVAYSYLHHYAGDATRAFVRRWTPLLLPIGLAAYAGIPLAFELRTMPWMWSIGFTIVAIGAVLLVAVTVEREWPGVLPITALAGVGVYSYSIYLWHKLVITQQGLLLFLLTRLSVPQGYPIFVVYCLAYVGVSIALGVMMTRLVEAPVLRWRDRVWPSPSGDLASSCEPDHTPTCDPEVASRPVPTPAAVSVSAETTR